MINKYHPKVFAIINKRFKRLLKKQALFSCCVDESKELMKIQTENSLILILVFASFLFVRARNCDKSTF